MRKHLYECILHGLVGVVHVAQVLVRDPRGAPLQQRDQLSEAFSRGVTFSRDDECLDFGRQLRVARQWRDTTAGQWQLPEVTCAAESFWA